MCPPPDLVVNRWMSHGSQGFHQPHFELRQINPGYQYHSGFQDSCAKPTSARCRLQQFEGWWQAEHHRSIGYRDVTPFRSSGRDSWLCRCFVFPNPFGSSTRNRESMFFFCNAKSLRNLIFVATEHGVAPFRGQLRWLFHDSVGKGEFKGLAWLFAGGILLPYDEEGLNDEIGWNWSGKANAINLPWLGMVYTCLYKPFIVILGMVCYWYHMIVIERQPVRTFDFDRSSEHLNEPAPPFATLASEHSPTKQWPPSKGRWRTTLMNSGSCCSRRIAICISAGKVWKKPAVTGWWFQNA